MGNQPWTWLQCTTEKTKKNNQVSVTQMVNSTDIYWNMNLHINKWKFNQSSSLFYSMKLVGKIKHIQTPKREYLNINTQCGDWLILDAQIDKQKRGVNHWNVLFTVLSLPQSPTKKDATWKWQTCLYQMSKSHPSFAREVHDKTGGLFRPPKKQKPLVRPNQAIIWGKCGHNVNPPAMDQHPTSHLQSAKIKVIS